MKEEKFYRLEAYGTSISFLTSKTNFEDACREFDKFCEHNGLDCSGEGEWCLIDSEGNEVEE